MFTGIVAAVGQVVDVTPSTGGLKLRIAAGPLPLEDVGIGDSIAVNGACLTVVSRTEHTFDVDVSRETLACVVGFDVHAPVNLEKALRMADRLGGHLMSGHVDGIGVVESVTPAGDNRALTISVPEALARYVARKGSVAVDGVSLTVNEVSGNRFSVNLIPHTIASTNFDTLQAGTRVNIEIDLVARYVERLFSASSHAPGTGPEPGKGAT